MREHEIKGRIIHETDKAVLFRRYGDKDAKWYPNQSVITRREPRPGSGSYVFRIHDWVYRRNCIGVEKDPDFTEESQEATPDRDRDKIITDDKVLSEIPGTVRECMEYMSNADLAKHFDHVIAELDDRGLVVEDYYK